MGPWPTAGPSRVRRWRRSVSCQQCARGYGTSTFPPLQEIGSMTKLHFAIATLALAFGASTVSAQDAQPQGQTPRGQGGGRMMTALFQGITLTAEQQTKV